jgi:hypothetical protein
VMQEPSGVVLATQLTVQLVSREALLAAGAHREGDRPLAKLRVARKLVLYPAELRGVCVGGCVFSISAAAPGHGSVTEKNPTGCEGWRV